MIDELLTAVVPTVVGSSLGFWMGKRKTTADAVTTELENVKIAITIWQKTAEDISGKYTQLLAEHSQLADTHRQILVELQTLKGENAALRTQIAHLSVQLSKVN